MNKKILGVFIGLFLIAGVLAGISIGNVLEKDIELTKAEKDTLESVKITTPTLSNCIKINDYNCRYNIYQKDAINKDVTLTIKECLNWSKSENESDIDFEPECLDWWNADKTEIETLMQEKTKEILEEIAKVTDIRNADEKEYLTDAIEITIKEGK